MAVTGAVIAVVSALAIVAETAAEWMTAAAVVTVEVETTRALGSRQDHAALFVVGNVARSAVDNAARFEVGNAVVATKTMHSATHRVSQFAEEKQAWAEDVMVVVVSTTCPLEEPESSGRGIERGWLSNSNCDSD